MQIVQSKHPEMLCENACLKRCKREDLLHYLRATAKNWNSKPRWEFFQKQLAEKTWSSDLYNKVASIRRIRPRWWLTFWWLFASQLLRLCYWKHSLKTCETRLYEQGGSWLQLLLTVEVHKRQWSRKCEKLSWRDMSLWCSWTMAIRGGKHNSLPTS